MAQTRRFQGTARKITVFNGHKLFWYHNTAVVTVTPNGDIMLDSGGWRTVTTKLAMNQASNEYGLGFSVSQRKGEWYVSTDNRLYEWEFEDRMIIRKEFLS